MNEPRYGEREPDGGPDIDGEQEGPEAYIPLKPPAKEKQAAWTPANWASIGVLLLIVGPFLIWAYRWALGLL
jgi:hypothetical protein